MSLLLLNNCMKMLMRRGPVAHDSIVCKLCNRSYHHRFYNFARHAVILRQAQIISHSLTQRGFSSEVWLPHEKKEGLLKEVNKEIVQNVGRMFAVVHIGGSQFKVSPEDLIQIQGHIEADMGERICLEKVLLLGGDNFTVIGKPLISPQMVRVEATVIEKTMSEKKILFRFKKRKNYKKYKEMYVPLTVLRINTIDVNPVLS